ncbi:hypothetical protein H4S06_000429 [Coemansia sp. BCRC 34490]|nr:hypothetical protein H4S06_000429 [Coemansia sp. BCRC 34490]
MTSGVQQETPNPKETVAAVAMPAANGVQQGVSKQHAEKLDTCYKLLQKMQIMLDAVAGKVEQVAIPPPVQEATVSADSQACVDDTVREPSKKSAQQFDIPMRWPTLGISSETDSINANIFFDQLKMCMLVKGYDFDEAGPRAILANVDASRRIAFIEHCSDDGSLPKTWKEACEKFLEIDPQAVMPENALSRIQILKIDIYQPFSKFVLEFEWLRKLAQLDPKDDATYDLFVKCLCPPLASMAMNFVQAKVEKGADHIEKLYKCIRYAENEFYLLVKDDEKYKSWVESYNRAAESLTFTKYLKVSAERSNSNKPVRPTNGWR